MANVTIMASVTYAKCNYDKSILANETEPILQTLYLPPVLYVVNTTYLDMSGTTIKI